MVKTDHWCSIKNKLAASSIERIESMSTELTATAGVFAPSHGDNTLCGIQAVKDCFYTNDIKPGPG